MNESVRFNMNAPADLLARFRGVAEANDRSVSAHLRWLMRQACDAHEANVPEGTKVVRGLNHLITCGIFAGGNGCDCGALWAAVKANPGGSA